jgi:small subunit ribosomal protein S3Ae
MINYVDDYTTSDGYVFRVSATAFSQRRINSAKKHEIRLSMAKLLGEKIPLLSLDEFVKEVTMGKMSSEMMDVAKKIAIIRHVGVKKTKLLSSPLEVTETESDLDGSVTEANSEVSTEANSEVSTEANSEVSTEANSEVSTEANSEVSTEEENVTSSKEESGKDETT